MPVKKQNPKKDNNGNNGMGNFKKVFNIILALTVKYTKKERLEVFIHEKGLSGNEYPFSDY